MSNNQSNDSDVGFVLRALRRRKWLFGGLFLVLAASVVIGLAVRQDGAVQSHTYLSSAQLLVSPPSDRDVPADAEKMTRWFASEQLFREMIVSEDVLTRVLKASRLELDLASLRDMVTVAAPQDDQRLSDVWGNFLVDIQVEADSPETSKNLADLVVKEAIEYTQELAAREVIASRRQLEKMAQANKQAIEAAERDLIEWRKAHDMWDVEQLLEEQGARITDLQTKKAEAALTLSAETKKLDQLQAYLHGDDESLPAALLANDELRDLSRACKEKRRSLEEARAVYQESNEIVVQKLAELDEAESSYLASKRAAVGALIAEQEGVVQQARAHLGGLDSSLQNLKDDKRLVDSQLELRQLKSDLETLRENQKDLTAQINEAKVQEEKRRYLAAFTLVQKPQQGVLQVPNGTATASPQVVLSGLLLSLFCAGLATVGAETLSASLEIRPKVEKTLGLPILGTLPRLPKATAGMLSVLEQAPDSFASERFRSIVVNLMRQKGSTKRLLVTSCWPGEGKTFVARNLAVALSRFEAKTLLVDGDLRKPHLSETINRLEAPGLRQYLSGEVPFEELTIPGPSPGLAVLPAGQGAGNPAELLGKTECKTRMLALGEDRTLVIDSSPLSVCSDSVLMSEAVDAVVLVVNAGKWEGQPELHHVLDLEDQGVEIVGVILNGVKDEELKYGVKSYHSGYYNLKRASDRSNFFEK